MNEDFDDDNDVEKYHEVDDMRMSRIEVRKTSKLVAVREGSTGHDHEQLEIWMLDNLLQNRLEDDLNWLWKEAEEVACMHHQQVTDLSNRVILLVGERMGQMYDWSKILIGE